MKYAGKKGESKPIARMLPPKKKLRCVSEVQVLSRCSHKARNKVHRLLVFRHANPHCPHLTALVECEYVKRLNFMEWPLRVISGRPPPLLIGVQFDIDKR